MVQKCLLIALSCFFSITTLFSQHVILKGIITDAETQESLQGANIYLPKYKQGQTSDGEGRFKFVLPTKDATEVVVSYVGYTTQVILFSATRDTTLAVKMVQDNRLSEVEVYAPHRNFGVDDSQMSAVELPIAQVKTMPSLFGEVDVMKSLQKLPGVQATNDGGAGIYVRGGNYDQNLIILDGSTLYNAEHLKGFVSALNADMIENIHFYKGAFPARFGSRLSSVIDIGMKDGNMKKYHGSIGIGILSSRLQFEGPIHKETTSFNIGIRVSYFNAIVQPLLKSVYNKPESLRPYSRMNYYDINAKLVHRFSDKDKLSAVFYWGKDVNDVAPTASKQEYKATEYIDGVAHIMQYDNKLDNTTQNSWGNIVSSLFWVHRLHKDFSTNVNASFSRYYYLLKMGMDVFKRKDEISPREYLLKLYDEHSYAQYHSIINDGSLSIDFHNHKYKQHELRWGTKFSIQQLKPVVDVYKDVYSKAWNDSYGYIEEEQHIDTILGHKHDLKTWTLYIEDDYKVAPRWKMNAGLRYSLFMTQEKKYHSLEPRLSMRYLISEKMSLKASYSRMAQAIHLLSSSNLVMPSDLWVPITKDIPLMTSNQWAIGYSCNPYSGFYLLIEGYYKQMNNVLDYREGSSYMNASGDWPKMVARGKGKSYGFEFLLQKKEGNSTGWIGYTWSKSYRKYDRKGEEISGGKEFYAGNDRRHNLNIVFQHRFNEKWDVSATWTYQTGRRGILSTTAVYGGKLDEYDPIGNPTSSDSYLHGDRVADVEDGATYYRKFSRFYTYAERNGYKLPDTHRLDISVRYTLKNRIGESNIGLTIYNVYNRQNTSNVYIGYENNQTVLKSICMFPFMPSLNYTLNF